MAGQGVDLIRNGDPQKAIPGENEEDSGLAGNSGLKYQ